MKKIIQAHKDNTRELNFHNERNEIGERYVFCDLNLIPDSKLYAITRVFDKISNEDGKSDYIEPHSHNTDSLWVFMGKASDLTGLKVLVELDGKKEIINSPASVYIPANIRHKYLPLQGSGYYINILITNGKHYNELTF